MHRGLILGLTICGTLVIGAAVGLPALASANLERDQGVVHSRKIDANGEGIQNITTTSGTTDDRGKQTLTAEAPDVKALSAAERKPFEAKAREALARDLGFNVPGDYVCTASGVADHVSLFFAPKGTLSETNDALIGIDAPAVVVYQAMFTAADVQAGTGNLGVLQRLNMGDATSKDVLSMSATLTDEEIAFYEQKAKAYAQGHGTELGARLEVITVSGSFDVGAMITFENNAGGTMTYLVTQTGEISGYSHITPKG